MAGRLDYWDYDRNAAITCDRCGWTGTGGQELHPSRLSWLYLHGDKRSAPDRVDTLNGSLGDS